MIKSHPYIIDQYHYEYLTWIRILEFIRQENAILKTRLSQVLDHNTGQEFLNTAEQFQNHFVIKDDCIDELKKDIRQLERSFETFSMENKTMIDPRIKTVHSKLRNEMEMFEMNFMQLKNKFNKYLASLV